MTVYVIQEHHTYDVLLEKYVPKFDVSPAREFGEIQFLLGPKARPFGIVDGILSELKTKLADFTDDDFLLLVGNPILIAMAAMVASEVNDGKVNMLQWSGTYKKYVPVCFDMHSV